jgi:bifunctional DNA-binding transcriptional regulator/antitoxin component of YhaV-PrlF toxin-antitoxin module
VRDALGLKAEDRLAFRKRDDGTVVVEAVNAAIRRSAGR